MFLHLKARQIKTPLTLTHGRTVGKYLQVSSGQAVDDKQMWRVLRATRDNTCLSGYGPFKNKLQQIPKDIQMIFCTFKNVYMCA